MMCYKDRTFCPFWRECEAGEICRDALTEKVYDAAVSWWGGIDAPISQFAGRPNCWIGKKPQSPNATAEHK